MSDPPSPGTSENTEPGAERLPHCSHHRPPQPKIISRKSWPSVLVIIRCEKAYIEPTSVFLVRAFEIAILIVADLEISGVVHAPRAMRPHLTHARVEHQVAMHGKLVSPLI